MKILNLTLKFVDVDQIPEASVYAFVCSMFSQTDRLLIHDSFKVSNLNRASLPAFY